MKNTQRTVSSRFPQQQQTSWTRAPTHKSQAPYHTKKFDLHTLQLVAKLLMRFVMGIFALFLLGMLSITERDNFNGKSMSEVRVSRNYFPRFLFAFIEIDTNVGKR